VRLNADKIDSLIEVIASFIGNEQAELRLFGSRTQDDNKGGDIDLLLLTKDNESSSKLLLKKHFMLAAIKKRLGDQKIDLIITSQKEITNDSFLKMIYPDSVVLKKW